MMNWVLSWPWPWHWAVAAWGCHGEPIITRKRVGHLDQSARTHGPGQPVDKKILTHYLKVLRYRAKFVLQVRYQKVIWPPDAITSCIHTTIESTIKCRRTVKELIVVVRIRPLLTDHSHLQWGFFCQPLAGLSGPRVRTHSCNDPAPGRLGSWHTQLLQHR